MLVVAKKDPPVKDFREFIAYVNANDAAQFRHRGSAPPRT
jgi:hypothetical protein